METVTAHTDACDATLVVSPENIESEFQPVVAVYDPEDLAFELGAWLIGLRTFGGTCRDAFANDASGGHPDLRREFRIVSAALQHCSKLSFRLRKTLAGWNGEGVQSLELPTGHLDEVGASIRDICVLGAALSESNELSYGEWRAWNAAIETGLVDSTSACWFTSYATSKGLSGLPSVLKEILAGASIQFSDRADFNDILPRVGTILRLLDIVGKMLRNDEPLKPSLLMFAAVYEQTQQLIEHINNRLARFPDEDAVLFASLDSASYGASLELKKVFQQELRGIVGVLPPTSVYARIETAYSLLLDSFQQILIDLTRSMEPNVSQLELFPRYQIKLDQSLILREHLWQVLKVVRSAEETPDKANVQELRREMADFVSITIRFLHYKDEETFERFNEEVHAANDKKDLVPILHRFGAYLETLFGQICMRAVLADQPFEHSE